MFPFRPLSEQRDIVDRLDALPERDSTASKLSTSGSSPPSTS